MHDVLLVRVFPSTADGGNPAPVVLDADGLSAADMMEIARLYGHESAFVLCAETKTHDFRFRFFVPNHEMEMCGHATLGALWLLRRAGKWVSDSATIETLSGLVDARYDASTQRIVVGQPAGRVETIDREDLLTATLAILNLRRDDLLPLPIVNATTSRTKTLVPIRDIARLQAIAPDFAQIERLCDALSSTGIYPFAIDAAQPDTSDTFQARQFPRSSGYPEDAATGIAAAALLYGAHLHQLLPTNTSGILVRQGVAMGRPSTISVAFRDPADISRGCWLSGAVHLINDQG